ncbi:MAG: DNA-3-methyladenine glycosylase I [Clostridia bacterium]|nr:DNA-3-methyladenine glycosylase I [Clostridia bacterium]
MKRICWSVCRTVIEGSAHCLDKICRCFWCNLKNPAYVRYHDDEWGRPCHDDRKLYELLLLESFQAGLSWECILNKREAFRTAFDGFDVDKVALYDEAKIGSLMQDSGIVRNRRKIAAAVKNSRVFQSIQAPYGSFDHYIWGFTDGKVQYEPCNAVTRSPLSDRLSADLRQRGMTFVGTTIVYAYLQAIGVINGHTSECFLHVNNHSVTKGEPKPYG